MADRGEGLFNWIDGADALPMLGGEVEESHEIFAVFLQAQRPLGIFGRVDFDEQIYRLVCIFLGLSLPIACLPIAPQCPEKGILWIAALAFGCDSLGKQLSTFIVLCCQHRC